MLPFQGFTLIKYSLLLIPFVLIDLLIKTIILCINTFACLKINQYSSGLFVSYLRKNPIAQKYNPRDSVRTGTTNITLKIIEGIDAKKQEKKFDWVWTVAEYDGWGV
jgi:hypothetical protein